MNPIKNLKQVEVQHVTAISPHSKALYEVGKTILLETVSTGREFCKSMIATCISAIPIYLGMLTFILPQEFNLGVEAGILVTIPAIGFLIAATIFTLGYLPVSGNFSLDIIDEIERVLENIIAYRKRFINIGLIVFIISTLIAIWSIIINIGVK